MDKSLPISGGGVEAVSKLEETIVLKTDTCIVFPWKVVHVPLLNLYIIVLFLRVAYVIDFYVYFLCM